MDSGAWAHGEPMVKALGIAEAGQVLDLGVDRVRQLVRSGELVAEFVSGRWLVDSESLERFRAERERWVTIKQAAAVVGCAPSRIERAVRDGDLQRRPGATRAIASVARAELTRFGEILEAQRRAEAESALARTQSREMTRQVAAETWGRDRPPDKDHEWWTVARAAAVFGVSANRVRQLVERGRLPATRRPGKIWIRRDHVLQIASARASRAAQATAAAASRTPT